MKKHGISDFETSFISNNIKRTCKDVLIFELIKSVSKTENNNILFISEICLYKKVIDVENTK